MDTLKTLQEIISNKFDKPIEEITMEATCESLEIDSLDTFDIIFDAEEKFGIKVPNDEVDIKTIADVVQLLDRLRAEQAK